VGRWTLQKRDRYVDAWTDFAVAVTGASAALLGLLFVALSINIKQIVSSRQLPLRAELALVLLVVPLFVGILLLVPQSATALGIELVAVGAVFGLCLGVLARPSARSPEQPLVAWFIGAATPAIVVTLATLAAGVLLLAGSPAGLYGLPFMVVAGYGGALLGTWVLLVEVLR
jgi:modulator of FtsH protease